MGSLRFLDEKCYTGASWALINDACQIFHYCSSNFACEEKGGYKLLRSCELSMRKFEEKVRESCHKINA